jgi:hypothetical protein
MSIDHVTADRVFRIGEVLGGAWRMFVGNILFFLGVPILIYVALVAVVAAAADLVRVTDGAGLLMWAGVVLAAIVMFGVQTVGQGVLLLGAFQRLRGEPLRIGAALRRAFARSLPLLGLAVLCGLGLAICLTLSLVVLLFAFWGLASGRLVLVSPLLLPLALVPSAILFVIWAVVVPACVIEGLGPLDSLLRSADLTKGCRWKIFGIMLLVGLPSLAGEGVDPMLMDVNSTLATVIRVAWFVVAIALWNCTIIMTYHDLRVAKVGVDTRQVAAIFD